MQTFKTFRDFIKNLPELMKLLTDLVGIIKKFNMTLEDSIRELNTVRDQFVIQVESFRGDLGEHTTTLQKTLEDVAESNRGMEARNEAMTIQFSNLQKKYDMMVVEFVDGMKKRHDAEILQIRSQTETPYDKEY